MLLVVSEFQEVVKAELRQVVGRIVLENYDECDVNSFDLRFYEVQYETMYNKFPDLPDQVREQLSKRMDDVAVQENQTWTL